MKKNVLLFFNLFFSCCFSQNLVPNPSFELHDTCPNSSGQIDYCINWFNPTLGTSDYFNTCFDTVNNWYAIVDVPTNQFGYQIAKTGNAYSGFLASDNVSWPINYREYIEVKLNNPLITGNRYFVRFYVSLADSSNYATSDIGLYFSNDSTLSDTSYLLYHTPQIVNFPDNFLSDKINWKLISGEYIAVGGEQYITIGNFKQDTAMDTLSVAGGGNKDVYNFPYYYIDDICITDDSLVCTFGVNVDDFSLQSSLSVYPIPSDGQICIEFDAINLQRTSGEIYNLLGNMLLELKLNDKTNTINLMGLSEGIYFLKIHYNNQEVIKKIVLTK